jgi:anti-sigma B factor antagonist
MMALKISVKQQAKNAWVVSLDGSLNSDTAPGFGERIQPLLNTAGSTLALDMQGLEYISSAGLREIFKAQKAQKMVQGKMVFLNLKPQIRKVFDIVNALPFMRIFSSLQEMDDYLDAMQKQVTEEGDFDH